MKEEEKKKKERERKWRAGALLGGLMLWGTLLFWVLIIPEIPNIHKYKPIDIFLGLIAIFLVLGVIVSAVAAAVGDKDYLS